jgi:hypothetical protein
MSTYRRSTMPVIAATCAFSPPTRGVEVLVITVQDTMVQRWERSAGLGHQYISSSHSSTGPQSEVVAVMIFDQNEDGEHFSSSLSSSE